MTATDGTEAVDATADVGSGPREPDVDAAIRSMRDAATAAGGDDGPGAPGTADPDLLRTALATLPHDDQRLLWDRHVLGRDLDLIAASLGAHARSAGRRLRRAEERLATAFAAAHARSCPPGCLDTRTALHDYARHVLAPQRRSRLEAHLFGCDGCMRAFIDVRQASWAVRDAGPLLVGGALAVGGAPVVLGAMPAAGAGASGLAGLGSVGAAVAGAWEWLVGQVRRLGHLGRVSLAAGTAVVVVAAAVAAALLGGGAPTEATPGGGAGAAPVVVPSSSPSSSPASELAEAATPSSGPSDSPAASPSSAPSGASPTDEPEPSTSDTGDSSTGGVEPTAPAATPAASEPAATVPPSPASPSPTASAAPSPTASAEPTAPPSSPSPAPSSTPTSTPTSSASSTPTPTPTPTPDPTPEKVERTVTLSVPVSRSPRLYRVIPSGKGTRVIDVASASSRVTTYQAWLGWYVGAAGHQEGTVTVTLEAPAGTEPQARLRDVGRWHD